VDDIPFGFLIDYGIAGIAALGLLERFVPVVPSYVLFVVIGLVAVDHAAALPAVALAASVGSLGGAAAWYAIGRLFGAAPLRAAGHALGPIHLPAARALPPTRGSLHAPAVLGDPWSARPCRPCASTCRCRQA